MTQILSLLLTSQHYFIMGKDYNKCLLGNQLKLWQMDKDYVMYMDTYLIIYILHNFK